MDPIGLTLIYPNCKPFHAMSYNLPKSLEEQLRNEIDRLVEIRVLEEGNTSDGRHLAL
jgi:hypothetical protein